MSFFFGDGFDLYALPADAINGYWDSGNLSSVTLFAGRFAGSRSFGPFGLGVLNLVKSSGQNDAVHHLVVAIQQSSALTGTTVYGFLQLADGATAQCTVVFRSDGAIILTSGGSGGTTLATYTGAITAINTWYAFEIEVVINNTTGSIAIRKNGNTSNDFSLGSLNTRGGTANNYANRLNVGSGSVTQAQQIDDLLWRSDASSVPWVGDIRCFTRMPASDVAAVWSRGGASTLTQSVGGGSSVVISTTVARLTPYTVNYPGSIATVTIVAQGAVSGNIKAAIYADNAGAPGAVLASLAGQAIVAGNNVFTVSPTLAVTTGQRIWLACMADTASGSWTTLTGSTVGVTASASYATFPQANPVPTVSQAPVSSAFTYATATANYALVQEPQEDGATSYVFSSNVSDTDRYGIASISATPATVLGVTTRAYCQKSDAGTRNVATQLTSGGTTVESTSTALNTVWQWIYRTDTVDPATSAAWTATSVNNATIGAIVKA